MTGEYNCHCEISSHFPFTKKKKIQNKICAFVRFAKRLPTLGLLIS